MGNLLNYVLTNFELPTNAKILAETLAGNKGTITSSDFTQEERDMLRKLVDYKINQTNKQEDSVNYTDYIRFAKATNNEPKHWKWTGAEPGLSDIFHPLDRLKTTLGQFKYKKINNEIEVFDNYDFNKSGTTSISSLENYGLNDILGAGPYGMIRQYAGEHIPPGSGRKVYLKLK